MLAAARATLLTLASVTALVIPPAAVAKTDTIYTVAGTGTAGFSGDGGAAIAAQLSLPVAVEQLPDGALLIAEQGNARIRRVAADGTIATVAGNGTAGYADDDGPATLAQINAPNDVAVRADGGILIADSNNNRVRLVRPDGVITTVAGTGVPGYNGDGIAAMTARLSFPAGVAATADGGFLIADNDNNRIRYVSPAGMISTVAGTGTPGGLGNGGPAALAEINDPGDVESLPDGSFAFTELVGARVRLVSAGGLISILAGTGVAGFSGDGGPAASAQVNYPIGLAVVPGGGYLVADSGNQRVRRIDAAGIITTVAGVGAAGAGGEGGLATSAQLNNPLGVGIAPDGDYLIADASNHRIRRVDAGDLPGPPPPPPPPPPTVGRNLSSPEIVPGIVTGGRKTSYRCDPGVWEGLPTPPAFVFTWWRGSPLSVLGTPKAPTQIASTEFFTPNAAQLGEPMYCVVRVVDVAGVEREAVSWPTVLSGSTAIPPLPIVKSSYGNVRVRGIDVFQVVQPNRGTLMFGFPGDVPFPLDCGGGTPSPWVESCGTLRPGDTQRVAYKGVVLDARKLTTAVVYVDMSGPSASDTRQPLDVTLRAFLNDRELDGAITRTTTNPPVSTTPWVTLDERGKAAYGVNFDLPAAWLAEAALSGERLDLEAHVGLPLGAGGGSLVQCAPIVTATDCDQDDTFRVLDVVVSDRFPDLTIRTIAMLTAGQSIAGPGALTPPETVLRRARELFPGGERITVLPYAASVDIEAASNLTAGSRDCKVYVGDVRQCRQHYVHLAASAFLDGDRGNRASYHMLMGVHRYFDDAADTIWEPGFTTRPYTLTTSTDQAGLGSLPTFYVNDGSAGRPITAAAHELGHVLELKHAGTNCPGATGAQAGEPWFPDLAGRLQGTAMQRTVVRLARRYARVVDTQKDPLFDLMSYCAKLDDSDAWVSPRNWSHMTSVLQAFRTQIEGRVPAAVRRPAAEAGTAYARGAVGAEGGVIDAVMPADPDNVVPAADPTSPVSVRALAADGTTLADVGARLDGAEDGGDVSTFTVPLPAGTAAVELRRGDTLLDRVDRSRPPTLRLLAPAASVRVRATDRLVVRWSASDPDGDALGVTIEYSADGRSAWRTVFAGPSAGRAVIPGSYLEPGRRGRVRVTVTDGFTRAQAISVPFAADGIAPVVTMTTPEPGLPVQADTRVLLTGTAVDAAARQLRGRALTWFAGNRRLGTGERLRVRLPVGRTTLRLQARDAAGRETTVTRTVSIAPVALRLTRLQGPARVTAGARTATLTVAASRAAVLRAGGRTFTVGPRARKLAIPLPARPTSGVLRLAIRVGDAGRKPTVSETLLVLRI